MGEHLDKKVSLITVLHFTIKTRASHVASNVQRILRFQNDEGQ